MALAHKKSDRPLTHDLLQIIIDVLGVAVSRIEITDIHNETYFARIVLSRGEEVFYIDARPSDSIALALRAKAPVFVEEGIYLKYKRNLQIGTDEEAEFKDPPEEFGSGDFDDSDMREEPD